VAGLPPAAGAPEVSGLIRVAREALARGDLHGALASLSEANRTNPDDPTLRQEVEALRAAAERLVESVGKLRSATRGLQAAPPSLEPSRFTGDGQPLWRPEDIKAAARWADADRLHKSGRTLEAVGALLEVHALLQAPPQAAPRSSEPAAQPPPESVPAAPANRPAEPVKTEVTSPPTVDKPVFVSDAEGIGAALKRYEDAYESRDASQVARVVPSLSTPDVEQIRETFNTVTGYEVELRQVNIEMQPEVAIVRAVVVRRMTPRVGLVMETSSETEFRMRRAADGWVIIGVVVP
jgi:hypothetical protein